MEINDIPLFIRKGYTGEQYYRSVIDQFETLYADSKSSRGSWAFHCIR